jgi:serine/threonine protein kinase
MMGEDAEEVERCRKRIGTSIRGKWKVDQLIGIGGMAAVYAATHRMGRRDALKILHAHVAVSKELRARFEQEAMAVNKLGHPGTAKIHDLDTTEDGRPLLAMELLEGESLADRNQRGPSTEREVIDLMLPVLDVLSAAHRMGIVHRDIKLDNLFACTDGRTLVLDFGIARMREGGEGIHTRTGAMLGTTSYMSPEQIQGRSIDGRADIFAVGACMFRLLSQRRLHEAASDAELLIKMGTTPAPPLASVAPQVSPQLAGIVDKALAFDAAQRFPDADALRDALQQWMGAAQQGPQIIAAVSAHSSVRHQAEFAPTLAAVEAKPQNPRRRAVVWIVAGGLAAALLPLLLWVGISASWATSESASERVESEESEEPAASRASARPSAEAWVPPSEPSEMAPSKQPPPTGKPGKDKKKEKDKRKKKKKDEDD